jgi:hypothetical protein
MHEDKDTRQVDEGAVEEVAQEDLELTDEGAEKVAGGRKAGGDTNTAGQPLLS